MISRGCGLARSRWVSHGFRTGGDRRGAKPLRFMRTAQACPLPWLARTAKRISGNSNNSNSNNNNNNNSTRIAITITITLALLAAQQAHGWAHSCADGNTGACCLLEQIWSLSTAMDVCAVASDVCWCDRRYSSAGDEGRR